MPHRVTRHAGPETGDRLPREESRRGQSMVEFALIFSLVLMLFLGIFEMGRAVWSYTTISFAARQAARYAIVRSPLGAYGASTDAIDDVVKANAVGLDPAMLIISKSWTPDNSRGSQFIITVKYPVSFVGSKLFLKDQTSLTVSSTASYTILN